MTPEVVVFDFDGTLAHRPGMWTRCVHEVITHHRPEHGATIDDLRPHLKDGFPWHSSDVPHPELTDPDEWWNAIGPLFDRVSTAVGIEPQHFPEVRKAIRDHYCDPSHFELYPDTQAALELLHAADIRAVILSNHVPELPAIVTHLDLDGLIDGVITSATIGFEKPHPEAFRIALGATLPSSALMIGDNPIADKQGAAAFGMHAVLVRHRDADHDTVIGAVQEILGP